MAEKSVVIKLQDITFSYPCRAPILDGLNFELRRGQKAGVVGCNGCGKTTFLHIIMGLLQPTAGRVELFGRPIAAKEDFVVARSRMGLLFQDADDQLFSPTVLEDVTFGPLNQGKSAEDAQAVALRVLDDLGAGSLADRVTHQLSGGEKKMVSLATVLAMDPEVLLLDEPTSGLDEETKARITAVLKGLELSCLVISHEYDFLAQVTDSLCYMRDGRILADAAGAVHSHFHVHRFGVYPHRHES